MAIAPASATAAPGASASSADATASLLQHQGIWRAREGSSRILPTWPTGHAALDGELPGQGWPQGLLSEMLLPQLGLGEITLLLPLLARLSRQGLLLVFVRPPCPPNVPALAAGGIALERVLLLAPRTEAEALWASEQILASGTACALLLWAEHADERHLRRLGLAVEGQPSLALILRPLDQASQVSPAALRLRLHGNLSRAPLSLIKARGRACSSADPIWVDLMHRNRF